MSRWQKRDRLHGTERIEDRAAQVVPGKVFVSQCGFKFFLDKTFDPYWCRRGGQEGLPFESLQKNFVYFAQIFEIQLEGEWS